MNLVQRLFTMAAKHNLPADIVYGVCRQESGLNSTAVRYEAGYRWLYLPGEVRPSGCSMATEIVLQKMSVGLMQVMGAVCREYGYRGWLTELSCDSMLQLEYGCRHLANMIRRHGLHDGIAAYNAGSPIINADGKYVNQEYVEGVLQHASCWQKYQLETGWKDVQEQQAK